MKKSKTKKKLLSQRDKAKKLEDAEKLSGTREEASINKINAVTFTGEITLDVQEPIYHEPRSTVDAATDTYFLGRGAEPGDFVREASPVPVPETVEGSIEEQGEGKEVGTDELPFEHLGLQALRPEEKSAREYEREIAVMNADTREAIGAVRDVSLSLLRVIASKKSVNVHGNCKIVQISATGERIRNLEDELEEEGRDKGLLSNVSTLRKIVLKIPKWKADLVGEYQRQLRELKKEREENQQELANIHSVARKLADDKEMINCNLVELKTNTDYAIRDLTKENSSLREENDELLYENTALRRKLEVAYEEKLCIPRLEEKMQRETKEQLRQKDAVMRQKEMYWNQVAVGVKEVGFWQQKAKRLELQLFEAQAEMSRRQKQHALTKANYERIIAQTMQQAQHARRRSSSDGGGGSIRKQSRALLDRNSGSATQQSRATPDPSSVRENTLDENIGEQTTTSATNNTDMLRQANKAEHDRYMADMTEEYIFKLQADIAKKDSTISRLSGQLSQARGYPLVTVLMGHEEAMAAEAAKVTSDRTKGRGLTYNTIEELLESYREERNEGYEAEPGFIEQVANGKCDLDNMSRTSEEDFDFKLLVAEKKIDAEKEAKQVLEKIAKEKNDAQSQLFVSSSDPIGLKKRPSSAPNVVRAVREAKSFALRTEVTAKLMDSFENRQLKKAQSPKKPPAKSARESRSNTLRFVT